MNQTYMSVTWDAYSNSVSKGFSYLQQNAEFVDMTLAAEGHMVQVHKNIMAVASPYLKSMLQSAPCQHPVVFLNNVSHKILGYLLEYIYTGEVKVPADQVDKFVEAGKSLCIGGVESVATPKITPEIKPEPHIERIVTPPENNFAAHITINNNDNDYDSELISNENNTITQNVDQDQRDSEIASNYINGNDINNIHNFILLEPNSNKIDSNTNERGNTVKIISDETIVAQDLTNSSRSLMNLVNLSENPADTALDANDWYLDTNANSSNIETELSAKPIWTPVTIIAEINDRLPRPIQSIADVNIEPTENITEPIENIVTHSTVNIIAPPKVNKRTIKKTPQDILSYIKQINPTENRDKMALNKFKRLTMDKVPHYTVSNRGSLQLIIHRYMFLCHHHSKGGIKRRWRCVDYRRMACPAYIDTDNDVITTMSENHCHPDHDTQIIKKIKSRLIFTSLSVAEQTVNSYLKKAKK